MQLDPGANVTEFLQRLLSCNASAREAYTAHWALTTSSFSRTDLYDGWSEGRDEEGNPWWVPRQPIIIDGMKVARIVRLQTTLYAEQEGEIAARLAERWRLDPLERDDGEVLFVKEFGPDIAEDGWHESRIRVARQWSPGKTLHGCQYMQELPEFGSLPDDEDDEVEGGGS